MRKGSNDRAETGKVQGREAGQSEILREAQDDSGAGKVGRQRGGQGEILRCCSG
ncbi:MAG: hypothetical protein ABSA59_08140 [Terriglobia bacterium]